MKLKVTSLTCLLLLLSVLAGCASAPQAELDQANHTAILMSSLLAEQQRFQTTKTAVAQARRDSVLGQRALITTYEMDSQLGDEVRKAVGKQDVIKVETLLKDLSEKMLKEDQDLAEALATFDAELSKLLAPLPDSSDAIQKAQKQISALGEQVSVKDRLKITSDFAQSIKKSVDENRKKIEAAKSEAPASPAQSAKSE
jgi:hypothetical protein